MTVFQDDDATHLEAFDTVIDEAESYGDPELARRVRELRRMVEDDV